MHHRKNSNSTLSFLTGAAMGGGLMYLLDPDRGQRRRAVLRDKAVRGLHQLGDAADKGARDLRNRARGAVAESWASLRRHSVDDAVLVERVRACLGRAVSHPDSIEVQASNGNVTLSGPVLQAEVDCLVHSVWAVRGVTGVENRLQVHKEAGNVPGLQGGSGRRQGAQNDFLQENWAPGTRLVAGAAGALILASAPRRALLGPPLAVAGAGLLARAIGNVPLRRFVGLDGRHSIHLQKTIHIDVPPERVFALWSNPENFPQFMSRVREVRKTGEGRYHWTVGGPAGISASWDSEITENIPNQVLAWKSVPGSMPGNAGIIRFDGENGGTRVHVRMAYTPPAGALGHAIALLLGADPKSAMDEDMARMKSLLEIGKTRAHGQKVTSDKVRA
jgi:uncharacterized membrane protein